MSFNIANLGPIGYVNGHTTWSYYDETDNLASIPGGTVNTTYFKNAYSVNGITMKLGDVIIVSNISSNAGTVIMASVPQTWDTNGASFVFQHH